MICVASAVPIAIYLWFPADRFIAVCDFFMIRKYVESTFQYYPKFVPEMTYFVSKHGVELKRSFKLSSELRLE